MTRGYTSEVRARTWSFENFLSVFSCEAITLVSALCLGTIVSRSREIESVFYHKIVYSDWFAGWILFYALVICTERIIGIYKSLFAWSCSANFLGFFTGALPVCAVFVRVLILLRKIDSRIVYCLLSATLFLGLFFGSLALVLRFSWRHICARNNEGAFEIYCWLAKDMLLSFSSSAQAISKFQVVDVDLRWLSKH